MRLDRFKAHCEKLGLELLPDDYRFIDAHLGRFPECRLKSVLEGYIEKWYEGMRKALSPPQEQNFGRRWANSWLRGVR